MPPGPMVLWMGSPNVGPFRSSVSSGSSITGVLPIGTKRAASNRCTSVSGPLAGQVATVELMGEVECFGAVRRTSLPTLNTCSTSSVPPDQKFSAQVS
ncbi:hypothetical protein D3C86_1828720 [compost metagenome]